MKKKPMIHKRRRDAYEVLSWVEKVKRWSRGHVWTACGGVFPKARTAVYWKYVTCRKCLARKGKR